jgi:hypothetical protein
MDRERGRCSEGAKRKRKEEKEGACLPIDDGEVWETGQHLND